MIRCLLATGAAVLVAAGCTGSGPKSHVAHAGIDATPQRQQTSPPAGPAACRPDQLRLQTGGVSRPPPGRLVVIGFKLENRSRTPCNGAGYPPVVVQVARHLALRLHPIHGGPVEFGDPRAAKQLVLRPGYAANFTIQLNPHGHRCILADRDRLRRTHTWSYLAVDHRMVRVCPSSMREAALYPPAFLDSPGSV
jgi:hypothetical protein